MFFNKNLSFIAFLSNAFIVIGVLTGLRWIIDRKNQNVVVERPFSTEVTFSEREERVQGEKTALVVPYGTVIFDEKGAVLTDMIYQRLVDGELQEFSLFSDEYAAGMIEKPFFLALTGKTPLSYQCTNVDETEQAHSITFVALGNDHIVKHFTVHKTKPQIDCKVTVVPTAPTHIRLFFGSPLLKGFEEDDIDGAFLIDQKGSFSKISHNKITEKVYEKPALLGVEDKYFMVALVADPKNDGHRGRFKSEVKHAVAVIETEEIREEATWNFSFYCGPKSPDVVTLVDKRLEKTFDYGIFGFITKPLLKILKWLNSIVHNYGVAILLLTLFLKLVTLPFSWAGPAKMRRLEEYQRKMEYLSKKFKGDKTGYEAARAELLQKEGFAPYAGCLPLLIPFPFFIALQSGLNSSLELYRSPFVLWITDLSAADPYRVLPLILVILFIVSSAMTNTTSKQNIVNLIMAAMMFGLTSYASAGICLFVIANFGLHLLQTMLQKRLGA